MAILIKTTDKENNSTWAIIELQGDLKSHSDSPFEGQFIGDLHFTKTGTPLLLIGHHLLHGKEVTLDKPYALLVKNKVSTKDNQTEYVAKHIITKKLIFKTRPKPIIGNV
ncbi:chromosome transmission fidelity protein 8 homolog [Agrilus planipennis]|uniref:Chromosome transmission fidelity protein 8 homolog n=1 Tax=Agrilus planipennis TaxID=224129 RepID=A0A7F5RIL4_AGRPL|nr:chromosome transmission fidelity protein 8 homolog [Agrilus planipennis]